MVKTHGYPNAESHDRLRRSARDLIDHGVPPSSRGGALSVDALQLLYLRASSPDSAADALKLLHELQTYQVELDLLYEQLQINEQEIAEELAHYKALYELAPAAYLIVANDGIVIEGNEAAGALFGGPSGTLSGKALHTLLAPGQEGAVDTLLSSPEGAEPGTTKAFIELQDHRQLTVSARPDIAGGSILMILTEATTPSAGF